MKSALLLVLLAASLFGAAVLTDDVYQLPAGEWRWIRFDIRQRPATVVCHFETTGGEVRAELVNRSELELFRQHKHHDALGSTEARSAGEFSQYLQESGEYAVVIENQGKRATAVHLTVSLAFGGPPQVSRFLSPTRRLTVILVSFAVFFAIVTFSARALLRAMKRS